MAGQVVRMVLIAALAWLGPAALAASSLTDGTIEGPEPEVRAVLFYSPQCPHCHDVMRDHLPPLLRQHGDALRIVPVNVDSPAGQTLYRAVVAHFALGRERLGVPALVLGDRVLVGAWEIPAHLPDLVEAGLAGAGVDWPAIPEVRAFMASGSEARGRTAGAAAALSAGESPPSSMSERFMSDPLGNGIAVVVLLGLVLVLGLSVRTVHSPRRTLLTWPAWTVPALALVGAAIASYMAFVEVNGVEAVCGPVGDCNRVQLSPYAYFAGVPVGVLGLVGYAGLGVIAGVARIGRPASGRIPLLIWGMAVAGVVFSIYLTFLEPFVIGATCMWCINSAIVMTLILVVATPDAVRARLSAGKATRPPARSRESARSMAAGSGRVGSTFSRSTRSAPVSGDGG